MASVFSTDIPGHLLPLALYQQVLCSEQKHTLIITENHWCIQQYQIRTITLYAGVPYTLAKLAICYCIPHFGY